MLEQDPKLIAPRQGACMGCACGFQWNDLESSQVPQVGSATPCGAAGDLPQRSAETNRKCVQQALLHFGAPLLLLLLGAVGAATFAADRPHWALVGAAPLLCVAVGRAAGSAKRLLRWPFGMGNRGAGC